MAETMNAARAGAILAAFGADPARWPADERDAMAAWLAAHPQSLQAAREEAGFIDAALAHDIRETRPSAALAERVRAGIPVAGETVTPFRVRVSRNAGALAALAACAVLGVVLGFSSVAATDDATADADAALGAALDGILSGGEG